MRFWWPAIIAGMTVRLRAADLFKGRHFDREIIVLCVRWYLSFKLSSRDLVQIMAERGVALTHTTILRWVRWVRSCVGSIRIRSRLARCSSWWKGGGNSSTIRRATPVVLRYRIHLEQRRLAPTTI